MRTPEETALLGKGEEGLVKDFAPAFVYPIFGEEELIFGYSKDLEVQVRCPTAISRFYRFNWSNPSTFPLEFVGN